MPQMIKLCLSYSGHDSPDLYYCSTIPYDVLEVANIIMQFVFVLHIVFILCFSAVSSAAFVASIGVRTRRHYFASLELFHCFLLP